MIGIMDNTKPGCPTCVMGYPVTTAGTPEVETCITVSNTSDSTTMPDIKSATLVTVEGTTGPAVLELKRIDYYEPEPQDMAAPVPRKPQGWQHNDGQQWKRRKH